MRAHAALARRPDREVEEAVAAEVADRERVAELVVVLGVVGDPGGGLREGLAAGARRAAGGAGDRLDHAGVPGRADVLARHADDQVAEGAAADVADGERGAEAVAGLRGCRRRRWSSGSTASCRSR